MPEVPAGLAPHVALSAHDLAHMWAHSRADSDLDAAIAQVGDD
jgi:hypothetical protein